MPLRNKIISSLYFQIYYFAQPYERVLMGIPVSDASGIIPNIFSGGHNNIEPQFVDIDGDRSGFILLR
jgi:hypothetical protein